MNDPRAFRLYFDYVDPACLLLEHRLRGLAGEMDVILSLEPFEVAVPPSPLLDPGTPEIVQHWQEMEKEAERMGLALKRPWIIPWTRKAHELALFAKSKGCFREIHDTLFRAYLVEGLDIGRVDILVSLARKQGMDGGETKAVLDVDQGAETVAAKRQEALEQGVFRTPTLFRPGRQLRGYPDDRTLREFLALGTRNET
jgi:predicted DsbA family dithiol-disulfide isomerase